MIGPLHLAQVTTHMGWNPLCICCCPEYGGNQFPQKPEPSPTPKPKYENPFIRFEPINDRLATSVTEDAIIASVEIEDHFDEQFRPNRAAVDGLPDKAETSAPSQVLAELAHQSDFDLQEVEFLILLASEV